MTIVVSSPGKVLVAGGYLVLDPAYAGIVVSTSSRFYTVLRDEPSIGSGKIRVRSPQFQDATWNYVSAFDPKLTVNNAAENTSNNKFVLLALQSTISLAVEAKGIEHVRKSLQTGIDIAIVGGNDFYSQRAKLESLNLPRTLDSLSHIPPFTPTGVRLSEVHKTGLGSSAALITSLVTALLLHFSVIEASSLSDEYTDGRRLAHNLSQYVHCLAQGKVGSGFDVSAAVFGSHLYTRFDPAVLQPLMSSDSTEVPILLPTVSPSNTAWNYRIEPFQLPPLTRLMLADVDAGSDTPSLVGKVLKWRKDESVQAKKLWTSLDELNQLLAQMLLKLSALHSVDEAAYTNAVKYISSLQPTQWSGNRSNSANEESVIQVFHEVHRISQAVREKMREMGTLSGVPIEPVEQTNLLDACVSLAGVIGGGVPGAGGYDAIWLLVCDPAISAEEKPTERVEQVWMGWTDLHVSPLSAVESKAKGSRVENIDDIPGLKEAIFVS